MRDPRILMALAFSAGVLFFGACVDEDPALFSPEDGSVAARAAVAGWGPATTLEPDVTGSVNTAATEGCPIEGPNGRTLFFASNRDGGEGGIDIWMARRHDSDGTWGEPENLGAPVNSSANDFCPTPLPSGELLFVSSRPGGCGEGTTDIYRTRLHPTEGWLEPEHLGCEVNSSGNEFSPSRVPAGGGMLFFSSDRTGHHRVYVSARDPEGGWAAPTEVTELTSPGFNTARPNVSRDGREIVFDSDRPGGLGGFDIWWATRASITDPWSSPINPGGNVNSAAGESRASLSTDGERLTFGSTRPGGEGGSDIYVARRQ